MRRKKGEVRIESGAERSTGFWRWKDRSVTHSGTLSDSQHACVATVLLKWNKEQEQAENLEVVLDGAEKDARRVYDALGKMLGGIKITADSPAYHFAENVLLLVGYVRSNLEAGLEPRKTAAYAFHLGRQLTNLHFAPHEELFVRGRKVTQGGTKGSEKQWGTAQKKAAARVTYQQELDALLIENSSLSKTDACERVARRLKKKGLNVSGRTVRKYIKMPARKSVGSIPRPS